MKTRVAPCARPFVKWAGGKRQLLQEISALVPELPAGARYLEPFLGGGALFLHLADTGRVGRAWLSDLNARLVSAWRVVRDSPAALAARLETLRAGHDERAYYRHRERYNDGPLEPLEDAALFIYLNKAGFNGLFRVNSKGRFNVPVGRQASGPGMPDAGELSAISRALAGAEIAHGDFTAVLEHAAPGDFAYFDPPYAPVSATAFFTAYCTDGFDAAQQQRLRDVVLELDRRGCRVLVSNADVAEVRALYAGLRITEVSARRAINSKVSARGPVGELLIANG